MRDSTEATAARPKGQVPASTPWVWWAGAAVVSLAALWALGGLLMSFLAPSSEVPSLRGVRLGMTAEQVRARFDGGAPASYRTEITGLDVRLTRAPGGSLDREASFEIHEGMLVAVRLDLPDSAPEAAGPTLELTPMSVLARTPGGPGRVQIRLLSRTCPTHATEVAELVPSSPE